VLFRSSPGDLQKLADMFCDGDCARAALLLDSDEAQLALPIEFRLPSQRSLCDPLKQSLILCDPGKAEGDGSPANDGRRRDVNDKTSPVLVSSPLPKSIWSEKGDVDDDAEDEASPEYFGPFAILYELFSVPQLFEAGARALYLSLGADEANGAPSVAAVTGMLSKLHVPALRRLAAMVSLPVPEKRWSALSREEDVHTPLAARLADIFAAAIAYAASQTDKGGGGGGGGGGGTAVERLTARATPTSPTLSVNSQGARRDRPQESMRDFAMRKELARKLSRLLEKFHSAFSGSLAYLAASGGFPRGHASVASMPVELMCETLNAMTGEEYAASLMKKAATISSEKTALSTHAAYSALDCPDARFLALLMQKKVVITCALLKVFWGTFPFAAWAALAAREVFVGQMPPQLVFGG
jgi:hypothetical protein